MLVSNEETWLALLPSLSKNPRHLARFKNIMGGFFLLFDVTMDVSQDKCILGKLWESPVTRTTHIRPDVIHCDVMDWSRGILCEMFDKIDPV